MKRRDFLATSLVTLGILPLISSKGFAQGRPDFKFGVYLDDTMTPAQFDETLGRPADIIAKFLDLAEPFPTSFGEQVGPAGKTLAVYWETTGGLQPILNGTFDQAIRKFAKTAKRYGYPIILSPLHEMNLNEQTWGYSPQNTPQMYKDMWRKLRDELADATNIIWGLGFNDDSIPSEDDAPDNSYEAYYPGDEYVDLVGISAMKWLGSDRDTFEAVVDTPYDSLIAGFNSRLPRLMQFGKPIYLWETGCGYDSFEPNAKANYIAGMSDYLLAHPEIAGLIWLQVKKEEDWRLNDNPLDLAASQNMLQRL